METAIAKAVRTFRKELAQNNSRFFLIYSDINLQTNQVMVKVTTNTPVEEVPSMLGAVIEPTDEAVKAAQVHLRHYAEVALQPGDCESMAREMLTELCKLLTIKNIAPPKEAGPQS
jgi:hypothetical protein